MKKISTLTEKVLDVYQYAEYIINEAGYDKQVEYLRKRMKSEPYKTISIEEFFSEYSWVVFTCGFKADTVREHWEGIKCMCCGFDISKTKTLTLEKLLDKSPIKNKRKVKAIKQSCDIINETFIRKIHNLDCEEDAYNLFKKLPFIGDITVYHIMRNLGIDCFKPDRHITNLTKELELPGEKIFKIIQSKYKEYIGVIDYILWRASATLHAVQPNSSLVEISMNGNELDGIPKTQLLNDKFLF